MKKDILVGMSGGVDSALTAALLQKQGYRVLGTYCIMHDQDKDGLKDAATVARHLGIELTTVDLRQRFDEIVVTDFLKEYARARTPNPCIVCNPTVKVHGLLAEADAHGIEKVATGHYADIRRDEPSGRYYVAASAEKDQSYMLYRLTQEQLPRIVFPLFNSKKEDSIF